MPDLAIAGRGEPDRPNVVVFGGRDGRQEPLVVFVDRFERIAFHSEPGRRNFGALFD